MKSLKGHLWCLFAQTGSRWWMSAQAAVKKDAQVPSEGLSEKRRATVSNQGATEQSVLGNTASWSTLGEEALQVDLERMREGLPCAKS